MRSLVFVLEPIYDHWPFCLYIAGHILVEVDQYIMCFGTILGWDTDPGSFVSREKVPLSSLLFWMSQDVVTLPSCGLFHHDPARFDQLNRHFSPSYLPLFFSAPS